MFLGGDLLPHLSSVRVGAEADEDDFIRGVLANGLSRLRAAMLRSYPRVFVILGNDDPRCVEEALIDAGSDGLFEYIHGRRVEWAGRDVYGYACVPPTPFRLKDWERYDVSRYVDPGCYGPEEGWHTVPVDARDLRRGTIQEDLRTMCADRDLSRAILLFHGPPHGTVLDRAALDGKMVDHAPLDVHVGSVAVRSFIAQRQPCLTLHGHVHESARITGAWRERLGRTWMLSAAHDGPELALVSFDPEAPESAVRETL